MPETWYDGAYFKRTYAFGFGDCDTQKKASLFSVMKLLSEIAGDDYEGRGLGHAILLEKRMAFIISRMNLCFLRIPKYREKVVACTWERFVKGPFFYRDYEIFGENGGLLVAGSSQWFLVDPISREIIRPESLSLGNRQSDSRKSLCKECSKIKTTDELKPLGTRPIYYSDIDSNGHVNNAVYGKIASDFIPEKFRYMDVKTFTINFNVEIKTNAVLELYGTEKEDGYIIQGISKGTTNFNCMFGY